MPPLLSAYPVREADIPPADIAGLVPLRSVRRRWPTVLAALLTLAMVTGITYQLFGAGLNGLERSIPRDPRFFLCFAALYLSPPTGDYIIFRKLWHIPAAGFAALIKKRIANEVVVNYSGDAYFYAWARERATMTAAPFGAIKDVSILSAIAGNAMTLAMIAIALPLGYALLTTAQLYQLSWSAVLVVLISLPFLLFSRRVFSLPRGTLWWVFGIHCLRLIAGSVLVALTWHYAMPDVAIGIWLFLAAGRLLVSRLPLVPNKDLLFASIAILLIGRDQTLTGLLAFFAALTLLVHAVVIAGFGLRTLIARSYR